MPEQENRSIFSGERVGLLIALAVLSAVPLFIENRAIVEIIILANIYAVYVASWDILCGYTGQVSFGHALFVGGGAYTAALLNFYFKFPPWMTIFFGGGVAALFGLIIGTPCLRLRGPYFALATFAAAAFPYGLTDVFWEVNRRSRRSLWNCSHLAHLDGQVLLLGAPYGRMLRSRVPGGSVEKGTDPEIDPGRRGGRHGLGRQYDRL